ncbi:hypothetical protein PFISCL1PPCAC_9705, partial [Pristionchus fissidentatus]
LITLTTVLAQYNPCLIDKSACVPFYDFDVGCTCILQPTSDDYRNTTKDDVVMMIMGNAFPLRIFDQYVFPTLFRDKLDFRIPSERDFEYVPELPETIYQSLSIDETMTLFVGNSSLLDSVLTSLTNLSVLHSPSLERILSKYCDEGECQLFIDEVSIYNRTSGDYAMTTDLLHILQLGSRMVIAASSVSGHFSIPLVHKKICQRTCGNVPRPHIAMCERTCEQRSRYDQLALTGEYKRDFQMFLRGACITNFRAKYKDFLTGKASFSPLPTRKATTKRTTIRTTPKTTAARVAGKATMPPYMHGRKRPAAAPAARPARPPSRPTKQGKKSQSAH